ncbi:MAG: DoxX family protein [Rhodobacteraceae bacterium]|nr:DoxX family protein [Paracoccaceae bacterium]
MTALTRLHDRTLGVLARVLEGWFLPTAARFAFAAVLLMYFWKAAVTKLGDGVFGFLAPNGNAYYQVFPKATEAAGFDPAGLSTFHWLVVTAGTMAEFVLPALIILGLLTRLAALGMIGFVIVQSYVDVNGHGISGADLGGWFDASSGSLVMDQRLMWGLLFMVLVVQGAGPISLDRLFTRAGAKA